MALALTHLAESIFAAMVNGQREAFLSLSGLSDLADITYIRNAPQVAFCEVPLDTFGGRIFDGASRIDVVVRLGPDLATAFELKLGTTRLGNTRVDDEWLRPCETSHGDRRWKGNTMAILDRNFCQPVPDTLAVKIDGKPVVLTRNWFAVARRQTLAAWNSSPPRFSDFVKRIAFEDVVETFGGKDSFNNLVRRMLDIDFYNEWVLGKPDAG